MSWCVAFGKGRRPWRRHPFLHEICTEFVAVVALVCQIMATYGIGGPDRWKGTARGGCRGTIGRRRGIGVEREVGRRLVVSVCGLTVGELQE